ncbi:MAG: copper resistance protein CopC, partial [Actinobacteria bacterium]|nr:copper resistance protein CopC [Actinomycetota bacterium]
MTAVPHRVAVLAVAFWVVLLVAAAPAAGHAYLDASTPDAGGVLPAEASVLALRFTEQVDDRHTGASLAIAGGDQVAVSTDFPLDRPHEMRVVATAPLAPGAYILSWRTLGVDGHAATGFVPFEVGEVGAAATPGGAPLSHDPEDPWSTLEAVGRALLVAGLSLVVALPVFCSEVAGLRPPPLRVRAAILAGGAAASAGALVIAYSVADAAGVGIGRLDGVTAGRFALVRLGLCLAAAALAGVAWRRPHWTAAAALPGFLALSVHAMGGHGLTGVSSAEGAAGHIAMTIHVVAAALWAGSLVALLLLVPGRTGEQSADLVRRFFGLAVITSVAVTLSGLYEAYVHVPSVGLGVLREPYGLLLGVKVVLLAVLLALGASHASRWRPRPGIGGVRAPRSLQAEAGVMVLVLVAAGLLAAVPAPSGAGSTDGPAAVVEDDARLGDFVVRVVVWADPVRVGVEQALELHLIARTSRSADEARPTVRLQGPDGALDVALHDAGAGSWDARVVFTEPGTWGIHAALGGDGHVFPVRVLPAVRRPGQPRAGTR